MVSLHRHLLRIDYHGSVTAPGRATQLLCRLRGGDPGVAAELAPLLIGEVDRLAERVVQGTSPRRELRKAALVQETWRRLADEEGPRWDGRSHFLCVVAKALRSARVASARVFEEQAVDLLALGPALRELEELDPDLVRVVDLRFFAGLSHAEIAAVTGCPVRSARRDWETARAWLYSRLVAPKV